MELWQRNHIQKNLVQLIRDTDCNIHLTTTLFSSKVIAKGDTDTLDRPQLTPMERSRKLYDILVTRVGAYDALIKSLEDTNQTGALKILKQHDSNNRTVGSISYDKNHLLGRGCFGTKVFQGRFDNRDVAVKVINTDMVQPELARKEINLLRAMDDHENIVRYFMAENDEDSIYIALELCHISLQDEIEMRMVQMRPTEILRQCTAGIEHLHSHNMLHRDLKPANILLSRGKQVKISDFGVSKEIPIGCKSVSMSGVFGTTDWMAPEILESLSTGRFHLKTNSSCDIFSLGCIFHFTLTDGTHPFGDAVDRSYNIRHYKMQLNVNQVWADIIGRMISKDSNGRPTATDILSDACFHPASDLVAIKNAEDIDVHADVSVQDDVNMSTNTSPTAHARKEVHFAQEPELDVLWGSMSATPAARKEIPTSSRKRTLGNMLPGPVVHGAKSGGTSTSPEHKSSKRQSKDLPTRLEEELLSAVKRRLPSPFLEDLVKRGADCLIIEETSRRGVVHVAAASSNDEAIRYFASIGLPLNDRDSQGKSPIHLAREITTLKVLVDAGAAIDETDWFKNNIAHVWAHVWAQECFFTAKYIELVKYLAQKGKAADMLNSLNWDGNTPLHILTSQRLDGFRHSPLDLVKFLIQNGADSNICTPTGENILFFAARNEDVEMVRFLVSIGTDANKCNSSGQDVLRYAHHLRSVAGPDLIGTEIKNLLKEAMRHSKH